MGESLRSVCLLTMMVGSIASCVFWTMDPTPVIWGVRVGLAVLTVGSFAAVVLSMTRKDRAPDYLRKVARNYFNRDGFCFVPAATEMDGVAFLELYFQNHFEKPCNATVALRPARGFFMTRAKFDAIAVRIECEGGAFGVARLAVPVPAKLQGKRQRFEVGASVAYPDGKGSRLRFFDGVYLRSNQNFRDAFSKTLKVAYFAVGGLHLQSPATAEIDLPKNVDEDFGGDAYLDVQTLWKLGDSPLASVAPGVTS